MNKYTKKRKKGKLHNDDWEWTYDPIRKEWFKGWPMFAPGEKEELQKTANKYGSIK